MRRRGIWLSRSIRFLLPIVLVGVILAGVGIVYDRGLFSLSGTTTAQAWLAPSYKQTGAKGQRIPRFVSLKNQRINVRGGPGKNHAVQWVFQRKGIPVEIIAQFENWRRIRDADGEEGWIYHSLLSGARTVTVSPWKADARVELLEKPSRLSQIVAFAESGVMGTIRQCTGSWCAVTIDGYKGWVDQNALWGVYPGEVVE
ncbi:MAG: hypothetical protein C0605_17130 [Hyphomicrobiales bacterium]|nr:MAG: hypothetical protein C0605_17130 [Hyphomicrobiales bacterium]